MFWGAVLGQRGWVMPLQSCFCSALCWRLQPPSISLDVIFIDCCWNGPERPRVNRLLVSCAQVRPCVHARSLSHQSFSLILAVVLA